MTNTGSGSLAISSVVVAGLNSTNFAFTDNCPASLATEASCTLTIYLQPMATGTRSSEMIIYDNAGTGSQTVTLTGTGLANP
jgi:trimeric autotransporter adhesin